MRASKAEQLRVRRDYVAEAYPDVVEAIEADAHAEGYDEGYDKARIVLDGAEYNRGRADALREAAERVRALDIHQYDDYIAVSDLHDRVLAILEPSESAT